MLFGIVRNGASEGAETILADGEIRIEMEPLFYTVAQACQLVAVGRTKLYELIAEGEIPIRKVGRKTLIAAADLRRWAEQVPSLKRDHGRRGSQREAA